MLYLIYKLDITYKCSCQSCTDDDRALVIKFDSWQMQGMPRLVLGPTMTLF